jgi:transmembrane sensor
MPDAGNRIDAQASDWAVRVAEGSLTSTEAGYLEQWLNADTRHRGAFVRAQAAWRAFGNLGRTRGAAHPIPVEAVPQTVRHTRAPRRVAAAAAACLLLIVPGVYILSDTGQDYHSGVGEVRRVVLADGSTATIGSRGALRVAMRADERALTLDHGEAWFDVVPNPKRPFVVSASDVRVRAVGTAFAVSEMSDGVDVLVSEGKVEIWREGGDGARIRAKAGQHVRLSAAGAPTAAETLGEHAVGQRLAWRDGLVILDGDTLATAAERFNRYNEVPIRIADPSLAAVRVTGRFKSSEALAFASAAATVASARLVRTDHEIVLDR